MSSPRSMIFGVVRRRLGFAIVIAVVIGAAEVSGSSVVAAVITVLAASALMAVGSAWNARGRGRAKPRRGGRPVQRGVFSFSYRWSGGGGVDLAELSRAIGRERIKPEAESESSGELVMRVGSQFKSRLWGGYFVDPKQLPVRIEIVRSERGGASTIELNVSDRLGPVAIRDEALEERFALAAEDIRGEVASRLEAAGFRAS